MSFTATKGSGASLSFTTEMLARADVVGMKEVCVGPDVEGVCTTAHEALLGEGENSANAELVDSTNVVFVYSMGVRIIRAVNSVGFTEKGVSGCGRITGG
jgi:hypothetical protein